MMLQKESELRKLEAEAAVGLLVFLTVTHLFLLKKTVICVTVISQSLSLSLSE